MKMSTVSQVSQPLRFLLREGLMLALVVLPWTPLPAQAQMAAPTLLPQKIAIGTLYNGAHVRITGIAPPSSGVLIVIRGDQKDEFLDRKGRVGIIWLNTERIHIKQAPSVFLSFSSADVNSLLDRTNLDHYRLDMAAICARIHCLCHCKCKLTGIHADQRCVHGTEPDPAYAELLRTSFLNLKETDGSYCQHFGAVHVARLADSRIEYTLDFQWPRTAPAGVYAVEVYACRDRTVVDHSTGTLKLVEVGFPAYVASLASAHPWIYGSAAVLIAMFAGFGTDALTAWIRRPKRQARKGKDTASVASAAAAPQISPTNLVEDSNREVVRHR